MRPFRRRQPPQPGATRPDKELERRLAAEQAERARRAAEYEARQREIDATLEVMAARARVARQLAEAPARRGHDR